MSVFEDLVSRGSNCFRMGDLEGAISNFTEAAALEPNNSIIHQNLAGALCQKGDFNNGLKHFELAVNLEPKNSELRRNFGYALKLAGDIKGAVDQYTSALGLDPNNIVARLNLANILKDLGQYSEVEEHCNIIILSGRNPMAMEKAMNLMKSPEMVDFMESKKELTKSETIDTLDDSLDEVNLDNSVTQNSPLTIKSDATISTQVDDTVDESKEELQNSDLLDELPSGILLAVSLARDHIKMPNDAQFVEISRHKDYMKDFFNFFEIGESLSHKKKLVKMLIHTPQEFKNKLAEYMTEKCGGDSKLAYDRSIKPYLPLLIGLLILGFIIYTSVMDWEYSDWYDAILTIISGILIVSGIVMITNLRLRRFFRKQLSNFLDTDRNGL